MKRFLIFLVLLTGLWGTQNARAFVLVGPMNATELGSGGIDFNYTDDLGGPKDLKTFFRWNIPLLTYAFANNVLASVNITAVKTRINALIAKKLGVNLGFNL